MRVLIVEDERDLAEAIARGLRRDGLAIDVVLAGAGGLEKALVTDYDVIVLDRDLPGVHGDELCRRLAAAGTTARILMLTAASSVDDRIAGLDLGADDYLGKPFDFGEKIEPLIERNRGAIDTDARGDHPVPESGVAGEIEQQGVHATFGVVVGGHQQVGGFGGRHRSVTKK